MQKIKRPVVAGRKEGGELGYPTANLELLPEDDIKRGIWASKIEIGGVVYLSVAFVGPAISFGKKQEKIEVFIFDYSGDLYGKEVEVEFVEWLRPVEKFVNKKDLIEQIKQDCQQARKILDGR